MSLFEDLQDRLQERKTAGNYRQLQEECSYNIDFASNDYLGIAQDKTLLDRFYAQFENKNFKDFKIKAKYVEVV